MNGEDGLGAIYPPMPNAVMMYEVLGYGADHPPRAMTRKAFDRLLVIGEERSLPALRVGPGHLLTCHAMIEAGGEEAFGSAKGGPRLAMPKQVLDVKGDWA